MQTLRFIFFGNPQRSKILISLAYSYGQTLRLLAWNTHYSYYMVFFFTRRGSVRGIRLSRRTSYAKYDN